MFWPERLNKLATVKGSIAKETLYPVVLSGEMAHDLVPLLDSGDGKTNKTPRQ
jgi:hypothetical protein